MTTPVWCCVRYHGAPGSSAASAAAPGAAVGAVRCSVRRSSRPPRSIAKRSWWANVIHPSARSS